MATQTQTRLAASPMTRLLTLIFGVVSYLIFFGVFLYLIAFIGDLPVPTSLDRGIMATPPVAALLDSGLLSLFALQHSVMARPWFKARWTMVIPPAIERSMYVLISSLVVGLLVWQWRPIPQTIWRVENQIGATVLWGVFILGWLIALLATYMINHFELFGLRQVYLRWRQRTYTSLPFSQFGFYGLVRHPIMLGFILAFWATPHMTLGHLLFSILSTIYILIAVRFFEERDLVANLGMNYTRYQQRVRMLLPLPRLQARRAARDTSKDSTAHQA